MTSHYDCIDSHVHVFLPETFPYSNARSYTPGPATIDDLSRHLARIGMAKVVIVQPSPYTTDNRAALSALAYLAPDTARAITVVDPFTALATETASLRKQGVVGFRANLKTAGVTDAELCADYLRALDRAAKGTDLLIEVFLPLALLVQLRPVLARLGRPVILDHFAGLKSGAEELPKQIEGLADLLALPNVILKASGACRATGYGADTSVLDDIAPALFDMAPGRVIWGSDWPHTGRDADRARRPVAEVEPFMPIDDRESLRDLARWAGSPERLRAILSDTPKSLFSF